VRGGGRVEGTRLQNPLLYARQHITRGGNEGQRTRRRFHAVRGAHEQRVIERRAQLGQRRAHARLAHTELLCGHAHAACVVQGQQDGQQVQVKVGQRGHGNRTI